MDLCRSVQLAYAGTLRVLDELCDEEASFSDDIGQHSHVRLPDYEVGVPYSVSDMVPMMMDPPFPIFRFASYSVFASLPCVEVANIAENGAGTSR